MIESKRLYATTKRLMDIIAAGIAINLLAPLLLVIALFAWLMLGHPVLYKSRRAGLNGKPFIIFKFRSMTNERDASGQILPDNQRITPFGKALRRTSLDELPQLYNVLKGDMAIVGPRPLPVNYNSLYDERQAMRLLVKPGLTGWCQVKYRGTGKTWQEKLEQDAYYVENCGFLLDVRIILMTIAALIRRFSLNESGLSTSLSAFESVGKKQEK